MSFFAGLANAVASNLIDTPFLNAVGITNDRVIEVPSSRYLSRPILKREHSLVLYGPGDGINTFEIVLNRPLHAGDGVLSLLRAADESEASKVFEGIQGILPTVVELADEFVNVSKLQSLYNLLRENPTWNVCHFVAYYGLSNLLDSAIVKESLNKADPQTGMTPLHVAALQGKHSFLKAVMELSPDVSFSDKDLKGNNIYHFAAQSNKETIEVLSSRIVENINDRNAEGQTPLHLACFLNKPGCVIALMAAGADANTAGSDGLQCAVHLAQATSRKCGKAILKTVPSQLLMEDMKFGGTPLHWATSKEVIASLVELGCRVDARNFAGASALHVMVQREKFDCVMALLVHDADPNVTDNEGTSPLHVACSIANLSIVQALIVFGANVNVVNSKGETPRHVAAGKRHANQGKVLYALHKVGASRCSKALIKSCAEGCAVHGTWDGTPPSVELIPRYRRLFDDMLAARSMNASVRDQTDGCKGRLLSLDGGGIRGLVLTQMLQFLEDSLQQPIAETFDWIAGTSTGGFLALALASGKSVKDCKKIYFRMKERIFVGMRPYNSEELEKFLQEEFGQHSVMSDISRTKVIVTALLADKCPPDLHLFRNYTPPQDLLHLREVGSSISMRKPEDQLVWQAARATGAAPTYFRAVGFCLDGGLIANNPTMDLLTEVHEYNVAMETLGRADCVVRPRVVLSLGTGSRPAEIVNSVDLFRPESIFDTAKLARGVSAFGKLLLELVTSSDRRVVDRSRAWCSMAGVPFIRLSPDFTQEVVTDEMRDDVLVQMLWETQAYIHSHSMEIRKLCQLLKNS